MGKLLNEDQIAARLESALYSAGRPLTIEELIKAAGTESQQKTVAVSYTHLTLPTILLV